MSCHLLVHTPLPLSLPTFFLYWQSSGYSRVLSLRYELQQPEGQVCTEQRHAEVICVQRRGGLAEELKSCPQCALCLHCPVPGLPAFQPEQLFCLPPAQCARIKAGSGLAAGKSAPAACRTDPVIDYMPLVSCNKGIRGLTGAEKSTFSITLGPAQMPRFLHQIAAVAGWPSNACSHGASC